MIEPKVRFDCFAGKLLDRLDWDFFEMPSTGKYANTISMGWDPKEGLHKMGWVDTTKLCFYTFLPQVVE